MTPLLTTCKKLMTRWHSAATALRSCIEIDRNKSGGAPVLKGTRFTIAQLFAEIAEGRSIEEISRDFDLDLDTIKKLLRATFSYLSCFEQVDKDESTPST